MFEELLNKQLISICFVTISNNSDHYRLDDTLIFRIEGEKTYQFLVNQTSQSLREIGEDQKIIFDGELFEGESIGLEPINAGGIFFPEKGILIQEIREYWADDSNHKFLMGVVFSDSIKGYELPILTGGTEAEITNIDNFYVVIDEMGFPYEVIFLN